MRERRSGESSCAQRLLESDCDRPCVSLLSLCILSFLDALVVKQGRLSDAEKSASAQELQDMVRFGANRIFSGTDTEVTDADVDLILARGAELTRLETEKLKQNTGNDLLNFSLSDQKDTNFQVYEGKYVHNRDTGVCGGTRVGCRCSHFGSDFALLFP